MPTIWDRLADAGLTGTLLLLRHPVHRALGHEVPRHRQAAPAVPRRLPRPATLPAVSFVDPQFLDEGTGTSADDHPHADIRAGAVRSSTRSTRPSPTARTGRKTVLVINYDEWGGFFDHVPPRHGAGRQPRAGTGLRGFRVPAW